MAGGQTFRLRWDGFRSRLSSVFDELRRSEELLDVTLCCDGGHTVQAHRVLLSASSPCLRQLLKIHPACQHPVFFLKDTSAEDLRAVIEFIYNGEVNVTQTQLASFIKTAEMLQIKGLSADSDTEEEQTPAPRRRRGSASVSPTPPLLGTRSRASAGAERSAGPPPSKRHRLSDATPEPPTNFAAASANAASAAGVQVAAATAVNPAATFTSSSAAAAAAAPAEYITPNSVGGAIGASTDPLAAGDTSKEIKTEQIDLSDDDDTGADLEDTLMRLSSYEGHDTSSPTHIALDAGPSTRDDLGHPPGLLTAAGTSGGAGASGSAASQECHLVDDRRDYSQHGLQDHFFADPAHESRRLRGTSSSQYPMDYRRSTIQSDNLKFLSILPNHAVKLPPLTTEEVARPELDVRILSARILRRLANRMTLTPTDWREVMECIHSRYQPYDEHIRTARNWYSHLTESIVEQFPFLFSNMTRQEALNSVGGRLKNKFRNRRRPNDIKKRRELGEPDGEILPGPSSWWQHSEENTAEVQYSDQNTTMVEHVSGTSVAAAEGVGNNTETWQGCDVEKTEEQVGDGSSQSENPRDVNEQGSASAGSAQDGSAMPQSQESATPTTRSEDK